MEFTLQLFLVKKLCFFSFLRKSYERLTEYNSLMVQKSHRKSQLSLVYTLEAFLMEPDLMEPENVSSEPNHHFQVPTRKRGTLRPRPQKKRVAREKNIHLAGLKPPFWVFPKIGVPPKSSISIRFSIRNHPFWGTPKAYFWKHPFFEGPFFEKASWRGRHFRRFKVEKSTFPPSSVEVARYLSNGRKRVTGLRSFRWNPGSPYSKECIDW